MIARGTAGDCCILCGRVGIDLPDDHGCQPDVSPPPLRDWEDLWKPGARRGRPLTDWEDLWKRREAQASAPPIPNGSVPATLGSVAALLRTVASTPANSHKRNHILYWAAKRMVEKSGVDHGQAALALIHAAQVAGLPEREAYKTVRSAGLLR